jgi:hypothetical protein
LSAVYQSVFFFSYESLPNKNFGLRRVRLHQNQPKGKPPGTVKIIKAMRVLWRKQLKYLQDSLSLDAHV